MSIWIVSAINRNSVSLIDISYDERIGLAIEKFSLVHSIRNSIAGIRDRIQDSRVVNWGEINDRLRNILHIPVKHCIIVVFH
jgi:hypothetical protein